MSKIVAIEITPTAIRAAEINKYNTKKAKITKVGEIALKAGVAGESTALDVPAVVKALKELWENAKFTTRDTALVISGKRFTIRPHVTSHQDLKNLKKVLRHEAAGAIPEKIEEPLFDFFPTHQYEVKGIVKTEGLVITYPSGPISDIAASVRQADLNLEYVEFAPMAIARYLKSNLDLDNYVLANVRDESMDVVIVKDKILRSLRISSKGLEAEKRNLGKTNAELASVAFPEQTIKEPASKTLAREIDRTLKSQDQDLLVGVDTIFLSGPRANDLELKHYLEYGLNLKVIPLFIGQTFKVEYKTNIDGDIIGSNVESSVPNFDIINKPTDNDGVLEHVEPLLDEFVAMCGGMRFNG